MASNFNTTSIRNIMEEINQSYFLPDIQREYVWLSNEKENKIERLFDSILRGYPINSFLFWKLKKEDIEDIDSIELAGQEDSKEKLNFQLYEFLEKYDVREPHNKKIDINIIRRDELFVVLDGQQRLTSLFIGLVGSRTLRKKYAREEIYEEKKLYLNLLHFPKDDPDDMFEFCFLRPEQAKKDNQEGNKHWYKIGDILKIKNKEELYKYKSNLTFEEGLIIEKLYDAINDDLIAYFQEKDKDLSKVLNIFIRINSGGTQLSYSDLLMSILTSSFSTDIRNRINEEIDDANKKGFGVFGRDQLLKTALFLTGDSHKFTLQNFNKTHTQNIEKNLDKIFSSIKTAIKLLTDMGFAHNLTSGYIVTVLALWIYKNNLNYLQISNEDRNAMLEFVRLAVLLSYFTTGLDTKLTNIKGGFLNATTFKEFVENMKNLEGGKSLKITEDNIEEFLTFRYGKQNVLPILQILYPYLNYKNSIYHIDHIYPQSKFKKVREESVAKKDYIWNLQLLEGTLNQEKSDLDPKEWIEKEFNEPEKLKKYYEDNYINQGFELDWKNFDEFEDMRKNNIRTKLMQIFNIPKK